MAVRVFRRRKRSCCLFLCCILALGFIACLRIWRENAATTHQVRVQIYGDGPFEYAEETSLDALQSDFTVMNADERVGKVISQNHDTAVGMSYYVRPLEGFVLKSAIRREDLYPHEEVQKKYLYILGHYEQLGKTTMNFIDASALATLSGRNIVTPFVRDSRYSGLPSGWFGMLRTGARAFFPWESYFNINSFQKIFKRKKINPPVSLNEFKDSCSVSGGNEVTLVYFLYAQDEMATRKYINLTDEQYHVLESNTKKRGWVECRILNKNLRLGKRIGNISIGRQLCIDPEMITDLNILEKEIIKGDRCVAIVYWKGIGDKRTHFNATLSGNTGDLLKHITPSTIIMEEVERFIQINFKKKFIGVHIRSERIFRWSGLNTFNRCINTAQRFMTNYSKTIPGIFVADDVSLHGSDTLTMVANNSQIGTIAARIRKMISKYSAQTYMVKKKRDAFWTDSGVVALIQMHILARAHHLITIGDGNFQNWVVDVFRKHQHDIGNSAWRVIRCCTALKQAAPKPMRMPSNMSAHGNLEAKGVQQE